MRRAGETLGVVKGAILEVSAGRGNLAAARVIRELSEIQEAAEREIAGIREKMQQERLPLLASNLLGKLEKSGGGGEAQWWC